MKKLLSIILISAMGLSLSAFGGSNTYGQEGALAVKSEASAATSASAESSAAEWDLTKAYQCVYEKGKVILLETDNVRISALTLDYVDSSRLVSGETEADMALDLSAKIENLSDRDLRVMLYGVNGITYQLTVPAGESYPVYISGVLYNWNGMIGETEDCFQGIAQIQVMDDADMIEKVQFDWYSSEKTPFMNIITGDAVDFGNPPDRPAGGTAGETAGGPAEETAGGEKAEADSNASKELGSYYLTMSMHITMAGEDTGLAEKTIEYFDEIKEATDGHVSTEVYVGGTLAGSSEIYDFLTAGYVDIGLISSVIVPDKFPLSNAFSLPLQGFDDSVKATQMIWDLYEEYPEFAAEWDDKFEVLQLFVFPESIVKTIEMPSLEEIQGKGTLFGICVNKELWNNLPTEYQEIIKDHSGREASIATADALKANYRMQTEWLQGMGRTIMNPSDEAYGQWKSVCDVLAIQWAEEAGAASGVDVAGFLNRAKELYAQY